MSVDNNRNLKLKLALLSTALISASLNAITGMVPEMVKAFPGVSLSTIELITTIPSLFQMIGILIGKFVADRIGHKYTMLTGLFCCGIGGVIPVFLPLFPVIMVTRCLFGIGTGFINASLLVLIIHFFTGNTRSTVIGLNGTFGGIGSALWTFIAGQLLVFGWNISFAVYVMGFVVAAVFFFFVPNVPKESRPEKSTSESVKQTFPAGLIGLAILDFASVLLATFYVIKASTLITESGFGTAAEGSTAISILSVGSLLAGLSYGKLRKWLGAYALAFFFIVCLVGNIIGGIAGNVVTVYIGAFLLGYGYIGFVPFIQEEASRRFGYMGQQATNTILVFQSLGAFVTPYICPIFNLVSENLKNQFFMVSVCYGILMVIAITYAVRHKVSCEKKAAN